jgi:NAD(P)-dependent dehydrogenase (short-subunit alcohol dehydrogenase family)
MKWALVTGAAQRLGRAVALDLAEHGWGVAIHYRHSSNEAEAVASEARKHSNAVVVGADLDDPAQRHALVGEATRAAGALALRTGQLRSNV